MKPVTFQGQAYLDYLEWKEASPEIFDKINELIKDISRDYFKGLGKPEPLRHSHKGYWSRRITEKHRLIYKIENGVIFIASLKGHY